MPGLLHGGTKANNRSTTGIPVLDEARSVNLNCVIPGTDHYIIKQGRHRCQYTLNECTTGKLHMGLIGAHTLRFAASKDHAGNPLNRTHF